MVILQKSEGQLGNKLLISAHITAYCLSRSEHLLNFIFRDEASFFNLSTFRKKNIYIYQNRWVRYSVNMAINLAQKVSRLLLNYKLIDRRRIGWIHSEIRDIQPRQAPLFILEGEGFRSGVDLRAQSEQIRQLFTPKRQYIYTIEHIIASLKKRAAILVGMHIRRGDYKLWQGGKYYYDNQVYKHFIRQMAQLLQEQTVQFILCSDEPIEAEFFSDYEVYVSTQEMIIDLYLLAKCDFLIGPPSTFSGWASFYGEVPQYIIENTNAELTLSAFSVNTL